MSGPPRILLYAELLSNIRQVSVGCSLPSPCSASTQATVSADGERLTVQHDGEERVVQLPGSVLAPQNLPIQSRVPHSLSWRLPLASAALHKGSLVSQLDSQRVPWSASDLKPGCILQCRSCQTIITPDGTIMVWKDLPSENWAEMMEFWHCHKPDTHDHEHDHSGDEQQLAGRGYGANSRISGQSGTGFVDLTSFLFFEKDCTNLTADDAAPTSEAQNSASASQGTPMLCTTCSAEMGAVHSETASITLYKWQLTILSTATESQPQSQPSLANCAASILTSTLSRSGCSKSIIQPMHPSSTSPTDQLLHIWLFNGNITFTSSALMDETPISAVKVLYRFVSREEADRMSESMTSDVQEITLPNPAVEGVKQLLERSNEWLPAGDRGFREWTVGLLEKWKG